LIADLHVHTHYSKCSNNPPALILKKAKKIMDAIAITDHDTLKGALAVKKLNKDKDFEVIVGCEFKTKAGDIIGYYVNEEIKTKDPLEVIDEIHSQGGIVSIPHPFDFFRMEAMRFHVKEVIKKVDLIEGVNGRNFFLFNKFASYYARKHSKPIIGGSDAHFIQEVGRVMTDFKKTIRKPNKIVIRRFPFSWIFYSGKSKVIKLRR